MSACHSGRRRTRGGGEVRGYFESREVDLKEVTEAVQTLKDVGRGAMVAMQGLGEQRGAAALVLHVFHSCRSSAARGDPPAHDFHVAEWAEVGCGVVAAGGPFLGLPGGIPWSAFDELRGDGLGHVVGDAISGDEFRLDLFMSRAVGGARGQRLSSSMSSSV